MPVTVSDYKGNAIEVIAVKPVSNHPDDMYLKYILHQPSQQFVTHLLNLHDGGKSSGHYFSTLGEAIEDFNAR